MPSREQSIFLDALEQSAADRDAFLTKACAGNDQLRADVEQLLRAHVRTDNLLDAVSLHPASDDAEAGAGGRDNRRGRAPGRFASSTMDFSPITERPGTVIGPYKLME